MNIWQFFLIFACCNNRFNMDNTHKLEYNTEREALAMPEYGRNVLKMVEQLKGIPDRAARSEQAKAVVKTMEILNPQVRSQENWEHKLWDQLYMIAGYELDIDAPYPSPVKEEFESRPVPLPMKDIKIKAMHYGRNIEKIINIICEQPEGEVKTGLIRNLAGYMRQQYLIWNKDSVADETIFADIESLSDYRIKVPEGLSLRKISGDENFNRPGMSINVGGGNQGGGKGRGRRNWNKGRKR